MSWQRVPLERSLGAYCTDWDVLNARYYGAHPFLDSRFMDALLKYFGSGREQLFIHRSQGEIDGLVILRPRRFGIWQLFVPDQLQASPLLVPCAEMLAGLFRALPLTALTIELVNQDPKFSPPGLLEGAPDRLVLPHALTMNVSLEGDFNSYWNSRSQNLVKNIRRYLNRATAEQGAADLQVVIEPEFMAGGVARFGELESSGWKGEKGTAISIGNTQGHFYAELMSRFAAKGQAQVLEYRLGDRLVASRLVIDGGGMSVILKTTYDEAFSRFAPGRLLLHALLERTFNEKRHKVVEFYTNATQDQLAWATGQRVISHVTCFRWPWLAALYQTYHRLTPSGAGEAGETDKPDSFAVEVFEQVAELPKACKPLFEAGERDSFDLGSEWFGLLIGTAIPEGATARFYVLSQGGKVRCALPLLTGKRCMSALTTFYTSLYRPLIADGVQPDELAVVLRQVMRDSGASSIRLDAMDPLHPSYQNLLAALRLVGFRTFTFFNYGNWYFPVSGRSFVAYFSGLSSQTRNTTERRMRKFLASGRGKLEIVSGKEGLEKAIQAWNQVYQSSWKVPEPYLEFMPELIRLCARRGWLRMGLAYYDDEPIAAQVWIVNHGRAAIYKLAYSKPHARHSAGTLLTAHMMRQVLDVDHVAEVDYLVGDDAYKKDWMSQRRERWGIVAYNLRSVRGVIGFGMQMLGSLKRRLTARQSNANLDQT